MNLDLIVHKKTCTYQLVGYNIHTYSIYISPHINGGSFCCFLDWAKNIKYVGRIDGGILLVLHGIRT